MFVQYINANLTQWPDLFASIFYFFRDVEGDPGTEGDSGTRPGGKDHRLLTGASAQGGWELGGLKWARVNYLPPVLVENENLLQRLRNHNRRLNLRRALVAAELRSKLRCWGRRLRLGNWRNSPMSTLLKRRWRCIGKPRETFLLPGPSAWAPRWCQSQDRRGWRAKVTSTFYSLSKCHFKFNLITTGAQSRPAMETGRGRAEWLTFELW